ncbi:MAG: histidine phosphatase family protein [Candidatus Thiodiazotropha sp. (ex Ctena orbiculata)]|nr:histidine phosphatase family protein [Candidatus Thiodiazotropha taylori]
MTKTIFLLKHFETTEIAGSDNCLSLEGTKKSNELLKFSECTPIDKIFSSPAKRAIQSVTPLAKKYGYNIQIDHTLKDKKLGFSRISDYFLATKESFKYPCNKNRNGESLNEVILRLRQFIELNLFDPTWERAFISTHGLCLALLLTNLDLEESFEIWRTLKCGDIYQARFRNMNLENFKYLRK